MKERFYEMGYTPGEFAKTLLGQFSSNTPYEISAVEESSWSIVDNSSAINPVKIEVKIAIGAPRKIALLTLPVLNTEFTFLQSSEEQEKEFIKTFFKYFHKGGG